LTWLPGKSELLSVGMAVKGLSAVARGHGIGIPRGDVRQLPGVFIMDTGSRIRFSHARFPST
jgi:choline dehydrogenase-like flavoprotein